MKDKVKNRTEKIYLKVLGVLQFIECALAILCGILIGFTKIGTVDELGLADLRTEGVSDENLLIIVGISFFVLAFISLLLGWLLFRAANHPEKSTFLLVLTVISVICNIVGLFGNKSTSTMISAVITLSVDVLTLMAVMRIRREIED